MNDLFVFAAHNTVVALVLALFVYGLTRVWRNPPVAHVLWLLVLLKLVAPPVMRVDWSALRLRRIDVARAARSSLTCRESRGRRLKATLVSSIGRRLERLRRRRPTSVNGASTLPPAFGYSGIEGGPSCFGSGSAAPACARWSPRRELCVSSASCETRCRRPSGCNDSRLKSPASSASDGCRTCAMSNASRSLCFGAPAVARRSSCRCGCSASSMTNRLAMILAHELAHLRRRDHWVRAVELIVSTVYWWNPLVWVIRRQIHQAEDLCCDAWVRWAFPELHETLRRGRAQDGGVAERVAGRRAAAAGQSVSAFPFTESED